MRIPLRMKSAAPRAFIAEYGVAARRTRQRQYERIGDTMYYSLTWDCRYTITMVRQIVIL